MQVLTELLMHANAYVHRSSGSACLAVGSPRDSPSPANAAASSECATGPIVPNTVVDDPSPGHTPGLGETIEWTSL